MWAPIFDTLHGDDRAFRITSMTAKLSVRTDLHRLGLISGDVRFDRRATAIRGIRRTMPRTAKPGGSFSDFTPDIVSKRSRAVPPA
jgi:hypothetical protein